MSNTAATDELVKVLNNAHWEYVTKHGMGSINTKTFPEAYKPQALIAMIQSTIDCLKGMMIKVPHSTYDRVFNAKFQEKISELEEAKQQLTIK